MADWSGYSEQIEIRHFGRISWYEPGSALGYIGAAIKLDYRILNGLNWRVGAVIDEISKRTAQRLLKYIEEEMRNTETGIPYYVYKSQRGKWVWVPVKRAKERPLGSQVHEASKPEHPPAIFTGNLIKSATINYTLRGDKTYFPIHYIIFDTPYSRFLELGTSRMYPRPIVGSTVHYWATHLSQKVVREVRDSLREEMGAERQR